MKLRLARCPDCGHPLECAAARPIATCARCPCAVCWPDLAPLVTWRPRDHDAPLRLALYAFPRAGRAPLWVAAFRCFQQAARGDLDAALTAAAYAPELRAAPLRAGCARTPEQAARVALLRTCDPGRERPKLVSLGVFRDGESVVEPVTGWRVLARLLAPGLADPDPPA